MLSSALPTFTDNTTTEAKVAALQDYQVQLLDYLRYTLSNLDKENFNETGLTQILNPLALEIRATDGRVTALTATADGIRASVTALTGELETVKSEFSVTAGEIRASVAAVSENVESVRSDLTVTAGQISAVVSAVGQNGTVSAASIVAAINSAGSQVQISADHVDISGMVTFYDLEEEGATVINGANITTGEIRAVNFIASGGMNSMVVEDENGHVVGRVGYTYIGAEGNYGDKLWLKTDAYRYGGSWYYPAIKLEAAGGISLTSNDRGVYIYDNEGTEWMFKDGDLCRNGVKVLP